MSKRDGLIFANARAKSKENGLLSEERLHRIIESTTVSDGLRVLAETGYGGGLVTDEISLLLKEEERIATAFLQEVCQKELGFDCFFMKNDYHNVKVLLKQKYGKIGDISEMLMSEGNMTVSALQQGLENGFSDEFMQEAVQTVKKAFEKEEGSPRLIDSELDKALFRMLNSRKKSCDGCIRAYFTAQADLINIESFVRTMRISAPFSFFASSFLEGGTIDKKSFEACGTDKSKLCKLLANSNYKAFAESVQQDDLCDFEREQDNYLLHLIAKDKADMFTVAPVLGYYLAKLNEIKILRVVFVCIKNGVPYDEMKKRVRALYA